MRVNDRSILRRGVCSCENLKEGPGALLVVANSKFLAPVRIWIQIDQLQLQVEVSLEFPVHYFLPVYPLIKSNLSNIILGGISRENDTAAAAENFHEEFCIMPFTNLQRPSESATSCLIGPCISVAAGWDVAHCSLLTEFLFPSMTTRHNMN